MVTKRNACTSSPKTSDTLTAESLRWARERARYTQHGLSRVSAVSRFRIAMVECGEAELRPDEDAALRRMLRAALLATAEEARATAESL